MRISETDKKGLSQSLWAATAIAAPDCPPLTEDRRADIAVVGGGFAGLSAALHLAERGVDVCLLEAQEPGFGASGRNGGQVIAGIKHELDELTRLIGRDAAEKLIAFTDQAADRAFALIERLGIDCDAARGGWVQGAHSDSALDGLKAKAERLSARGADVAFLSAPEMAALTGTDWYRGGYLDRRAGTVQPLSYARGLAHAAIKAGAALHGQSPVAALRETAGGWRVETESGASVTASKVLLCTNGYSDLTGYLPAIVKSVVPFYSYQIATKPLSDNVLKSLPAHGLGVSETRRILSYYRIDRAGRFVLGARGALNGSLADPAFDLSRERLRQLFPHLTEEPLEYAWNGRVAITPDHLPRFLEAAPGLHAAMGWNGRGVALTGVMGPVLADWLTGTPAKDLPVPVSAPRPIPFHGAMRPISGLAVMWKNFQDRSERSRATPAR